MSLLPLINENGALEDGEYIRAISFCKANHSEKCKMHYQMLKEKKSSGFFTCPYGLSSYVSLADDEAIIYSGFKERNTYRKEKAKSITKDQDRIYNPILNAGEILNLIKADDSIIKENKLLEEKKTAIESVSHEVKKLNAQVKEISDLILSSYRLNDDEVSLSEFDLLSLQANIRTIYVSSSMIDSRFSLYDYEKRPEVLSNGSEFECVVYKKFDKIRKIFKNYMKKDANIRMEGTSYDLIMAYPSFEMIPLLIIENAVKYSYPGNDVVIHFQPQINNKLVVSVESYSPYCSNEEINRLFEKGYRGKHAKRVTSDGGGIGLYFVKLLCDLHGINVVAESNREKITNINGIPYAPFKLKLEINSTF